MENEPTVKLASNAMTTLEDTMERLGIPPEAADTAVKNNIIRLINSASAWIETITGRKFGKATYTHRYVAPGAQELVLTQYPIRAVEYVRDTENGVDIAPGSYDFTMTGDVGVLYRDEGWVFRGYVGGLANDYIAPRRYLEVKFTAGYVLPKDATEDELRSTGGHRGDCLGHRGTGVLHPAERRSGPCGVLHLRRVVDL